MTLNAATLRNLEILNNQVKSCQLAATDSQNKEVKPVWVISGVPRFQLIIDCLLLAKWPHFACLGLSSFAQSAANP